MCLRSLRKRPCSQSKRESAGRYGPPKVDKYDLLDSDEEELIAEFTETIKYLYEELVDLGYLS